MTPEQTPMYELRTCGYPVTMQLDQLVASLSECYPGGTLFNGGDKVAISDAGEIRRFLEENRIVEVYRPGARITRRSIAWATISKKVG